MTLTLHLVPHTHWDREWYLTFQQFRVRLVHLMDRLLDILTHDAAYLHFMLDGQTILLEDYLEIRPERADDIARFVREGRLSIGPWHVLPDEFLVAPESLLRNLMLGDRVCRDFGSRMPVGYTPDTFGHVSQLPQILRGFGIETAALRRGLAEEPAELWWDAPDGSRVLVCYLRDGYDNAARLPNDADTFVVAIRDARDSLAPHVASGHVLLMAGTDHQEPQSELPTLIAYANDGRLGESRLVHSSLSACVEAMESGFLGKTPLLTIQGELRSPQRHHLLPGVLSARMWIKGRNDAIETLLTRWAEPFAAWAELIDPGDPQPPHLTGHEPLARVRRPAALIRHAWRLLLQNHPHDSICGCSVDQVHREMVPRFDQVEQIAQEITAQSLTAIAGQVDTALSSSEGGVHPLIVFNPTAGPRTDVVTARLHLPDSPDALKVLSPDGRVLPHQVVADPTGPERTFFRIEATPGEVATYVGLIQGGRLMNYVIHQVKLHRVGDEVHVLLAMGGSGEPNHARLAQAQAQVEEFIASGDVRRFVIHTVVAEPSDLIFVAPDLPPYGYATFTVCSVPPLSPPRGRGGGQFPPHEQERGQFPTRGTGGTKGGSIVAALETDLFILQADPADGTLTLTDEAGGVVYSGLNRFVDGGDRGDEYNYCRPEEDQLIGGPVAPPDVRLVEDGPARWTLEIAQVYRLPRSLRPDRRGRSEEQMDLPIVSRVSLYPGVRRIEVETTVDNRAQDHRLRVHFPVPASVDHAHTEAHFHVARRPVSKTSEVSETSEVWVEQPVPTVPQRGWADVSDGRVGLMVANRGLPEVEFIPDGDETVIALTLLRCVGWLSRDDMHCRQGHAGPELPTPEAQCPGRHTFHYALIPHSGGWEGARAQAEAFRAPLRAVAAGVHGGPLPPVASLVRAAPPSFVLTAIKQPEEKESPGLVVRGVNLSDEPISVRLRPWRAFDRAARLNLNEEFIEPLSSEDDGAVTFSARPWEIVTVGWGE
jgi:hypothetical protein